MSGRGPAPVGPAVGSRPDPRRPRQGPGGLMAPSARAGRAWRNPGPLTPGPPMPRPGPPVGLQNPHLSQFSLLAAGVPSPHLHPITRVEGRMAVLPRHLHPNPPPCSHASSQSKGGLGMRGCPRQPSWAQGHHEFLKWHNPYQL